MATQAVKVTINLNNYHFAFDPKEIADISPPQRKTVPKKSINPAIRVETQPIYQPNLHVGTYESRLTSISLGDSKINEVIGWMLILMGIFIILLFILNLTQDVEFLGFATPLTIITAFFLTYINWLSMKFFVNS